MGQMREEIYCIRIVTKILAYFNLMNTKKFHHYWFKPTHIILSIAASIVLQEMITNLNI